MNANIHEELNMWERRYVRRLRAELGVNAIRENDGSKIELSRNQIVDALGEIAAQAEELPWGSPEQIVAENLFYGVLQHLTGYEANRDEEFLRYADKATTHEMIAFAMKRGLSALTS